MRRAMNETDLEIRNLTYGLFATRGQAPTIQDVVLESSFGAPEVEAAWRRLHDAHALVLEPGRTELRMANPFSAVPTVHRVHAGTQWWFANCAWDAFGICAALGADGRIETRCPDCRDSLVVEVRDGRPDREDLAFHCLVPARSWWDDIVFT
jgi:hypothetical protein